MRSRFRCFSLREGLLSALLLLSTGASWAASQSLSLNAHPTPYLSDRDLPERAAPYEIRDPMLGPGPIREGKETSTGAIWNNQLWIFGTFRSAIQSFRTGPAGDITEWTSRFDLFANLQFSGTERIVLGLTPIHHDRRFTQYTFQPGGMRGFQSAWNANIGTLFFEGDLAEIFPRWSRRRGGRGDIGLSIGRQLFFFQEGILINDTLDGIGITQNSLSQDYTKPHVLLTVYLGVHDIDRNNNAPDRSASLLGFHSQIDTAQRTWDIDSVFVRSSRTVLPCCRGDLFVFGVSSVQRIGRVGSSWRILGSYAPNQRTQQANNGLLLFVELNKEPHDSHNILYLNGALALGEFTSAARAPTVGGPLARLGILFAGADIGRAGSALSSQASHVFATALGYEKFINPNWQAILEIGGRVGTSHKVNNAIGLGGRVQRGIGRRWVLLFDAFAGFPEHQRSRYGLRTEVIYKL